MIPVIFMYALFAINIVMVKFGLQYVRPIFLQSIRLIFAGGILIAYLYTVKRSQLYIRIKDIPCFLQTGFFLMYVSFVLGILCLDDFSSARQSCLLNLSPFLAALLSYLYFSERLSKQKWIGLGIGMIGFIPLFLIQSTDLVNKTTFFSVPGAQAIGSIVGYTYGLVLMQKLVKYKGYAPTLVSGVSMFIGGICALITAFFFEDLHTIADVELFSIGLLGIIFLTDIIRYVLYAVLLRRYTVTFMSFAGFIYPLFVALFGWLILKESVSINFIISTVVIAGGLYIFYLAELRSNSIS